MSGSFTNAATQGTANAGSADTSTVGAANTARADSTPAVTVSLVQSATAELRGIVSVSVPQEFVTSGAGFSFALSSAVVDAAANAGGADAVRVTRMNGKRLPVWLHYIAATHSFTVNAMPTGALPIEVLVRVGKQSWKMVISERGATTERNSPSA
jgi:hypothetical protein